MAGSHNSCQDVSVAGRREGLAGKRSGLWFQFYRVLAEIRPRWVIIENVPGLLSSNGGRDFATVLSGLAKLGYLSAWRVLDAQFFGVPQRRRRVFIVGSLGDGCAAQVLFESESGAWDSPPSRETGTRVAATISRGSASGCGVNGDIAHTLTADGFDASEDGTGRGTPIVAHSVRPRSGMPQGWNSNLVTAPITTSHYGDNEAQHIVGCLTKKTGGPDDNDAQANHLVAGHCTGPGWWNQSDIAGTLRAEGENRPSRPSNIVAGVGVRRLTPMECERLQGFPDGHTEGHSDSARYRMCGNAVAVPCAEWIGRRIMAAASSSGTDSN